MMEQLKMTFVNVGYGESMILECPDSSFRDGAFIMLVDGGSTEPGEFAASTTGRLPLSAYLQRGYPSHIDVCFSTHAHEDHMGGLLNAVETLPPAVLWQSLNRTFCREVMRPILPGIDNASDFMMTDAERTNSDGSKALWREKLRHALNAWMNVMDTVESHGGTVAALKQGMSGELCRGLHYEIIGPTPERMAELEHKMHTLYAALDTIQENPDELRENLTDLHLNLNNFSVILLLDYHGTKILLPGDTTVTGYEGIRLPRAKVFKIGKHAQIDGANAEIAGAVQPEAVICTASSDRRFNSAHPDLINLFRNHGADVYFSDCPYPDVPPHSSMTLTVSQNGDIHGEYLT